MVTRYEYAHQIMCAIKAKGERVFVQNKAAAERLRERCIHENMLLHYCHVNSDSIIEAIASGEARFIIV